jgi:hypothetical protein
MNTFRNIGAALTTLADAGVDTLALASVIDLADAVSDKLVTLTLDTDPAEILAVVRLVEDLEQTLDRLAAAFRAAVPAPNAISTHAAA